MTKIDRYILVLFARTILICFLSLGGVFVVFHAFNNLEELSRQTSGGRSMPVVLVSYYGPYMLMLFDWTASIIALIAMLFTVGWLRRSGEMTALLSAGINHGRILRPMLFLSLIVVIAQGFNREVLIPPYRELLTTKPGELDSEDAQAMLPSYDKSSGILIEGNGIHPNDGSIESPHFRLFASYPGFGDTIMGSSAVWQEANQATPPGYLIRGVTRPANIDRLPTATLALSIDGKGSTTDNFSAVAQTVSHSANHSPGRPILFTSADTAWLKPGECFVATSLNPEVLRDNPRSTRLAAMPELIRRVRNPSIHSSDALRVMLHERMIRGPLDFCLVLLGLPLVVNRGDQRVFGVIAQAMGIVLLFFGLKTVAGGMGGSGYILSPAIAAWIPLLILGPIAFVRYRDVRLL